MARVTPPRERARRRASARAPVGRRTHAARAPSPQAFFTPEAEAWADAIRSRGAPRPPPPGDDRLHRGPLAIDVALPATDASVALCARACAEAADLWLRWMEDTPPLPAGMKVTHAFHPIISIAVHYTLLYVYTIIHYYTLWFLPVLGDERLRLLFAGLAAYIYICIYIYIIYI